MTDWLGPFFAVFGILALVGLVIWIWALVDCIQVGDDSLYQSGNKLIWVLVIVFLNWIGAILYFLLGKPDASSRQAWRPAGDAAAPPPRPGSTAPGPAMPPPPPGTTS